MELWIRSQNKGGLIKAEILGHTDGVIRAYFYNNDVVLGEYATEERALEVLDEIQQHINIMLSINILPESYVKTICDFVYGMPKE